MHKHDSRKEPLYAESRYRFVFRGQDLHDVAPDLCTQQRPAVVTKDSAVGDELVPMVARFVLADGGRAQWAHSSWYDGSAFTSHETHATLPGSDWK